MISSHFQLVRITPEQHRTMTIDDVHSGHPELTKDINDVVYSLTYTREIIIVHIIHLKLLFFTFRAAYFVILCCITCEKYMHLFVKPL